MQGPILEHITVRQTHNRGYFFSSCHFHLIYLSSSVFSQLRRKSYSQNLQDPIHEEHELILLMSMHSCNYGNCQKSSMNKPNLLKHIRTHTVNPMKCSSCEYETTYIRLYKNCVKLHTPDISFVCDKCQKKLKHRNQLRRHKMDQKLCFKKSSLPE